MSRPIFTGVRAGIQLWAPVRPKERGKCLGGLLLDGQSKGLAESEFYPLARLQPGNEPPYLLTLGANSMQPPLRIGKDHQVLLQVNALDANGHSGYTKAA